LNYWKKKRGYFVFGIFGGSPVFSRIVSFGYKRAGPFLPPNLEARRYKNKLRVPNKEGKKSHKNI